MISLHLNKVHVFKVGEVLHLRVTEIKQQAPGRWHLSADDVTPLPGAEPTGYYCHVCCIVEEAKPDGSLPDGWKEKKHRGGSYFVCGECVKDTEKRKK